MEPVLLDYGGKKCVLMAERKDERVGDRRMESGREFQIAGDENENERRPLAESMRGIIRRC